MTLGQITEQSCTNLEKLSFVQDYLSERHILKETIEEFKIGYCANSSDFPRLNCRVTIPVNDAFGRVVSICGRQLNEENFPKYYFTSYQKSKHLFNLDRAKRVIWEENYVVLVEGVFDAITLYQNGIRNVVAVLCTSLSNHQACLLARYCNKVVCCFDPDEAGGQALIRATEVLKQADHEVFSLSLPSGCDIDKYVNCFGIAPVKQTIEQLLVDKFDPVLESIRKRCQLKRK